jgi:hypothetical protein
MRAVALCASTGRDLLAHFAPRAAFVRHPTLDHVPPLVAIPSTLSAAETTYGGGAVAGGDFSATAAGREISVASVETLVRRAW